MSVEVLALATAKPEVTDRRIVEHFGLSEHVTVLAGATLKPGRRTRAEVIEHALREHHDVHGAHVHGIETVSELGGYGSSGELTPAGAAALVDDLTDVVGATGGPRPADMWISTPRL